MVFEELTSDMKKSATDEYDAQKMDQLNLDEKDKRHRYVKLYIPDLNFINSPDQLDLKVRNIVNEEAETSPGPRV